MMFTVQSFSLVFSQKPWGYSFTQKKKKNQQNIKVKNTTLVKKNTSFSPLHRSLTRFLSVEFATWRSCRDVPELLARRKTPIMPPTPQSTSLTDDNRLDVVTGLQYVASVASVRRWRKCRRKKACTCADVAKWLCLPFLFLPTSLLSHLFYFFPLCVREREILPLKNCLLHGVEPASRLWCRHPCVL